MKKQAKRSKKKQTTLDEQLKATTKALKKLSKADVEKLMKKRQERKAPLSKKSQTGVCRICQGTIVEKVTTEYLGDPMNLILGPGSCSQMTTVHHGYHCTSCGLKYEFLATDATKSEADVWDENSWRGDDGEFP